VESRGVSAPLSSSCVSWRKHQSRGSFAVYGGDGSRSQQIRHCKRDLWGRPSKHHRGDSVQYLRGCEMVRVAKYQDKLDGAQPHSRVLTPQCLPRGASRSAVDTR